MVFEYDDAKDAINREVRGIPLSAAEELDWTTLKGFEDKRKDYGEKRYVGYALRDNRLYAVVYTYRRHIVRIISLRKANRKERKWYDWKK
ncbi:MAG: BrnT family toxin [Alphaproteobacteria bacterium]|nr:BrnT family toxin [Alphaproteobacteria bacterium]